MALSFPARSYAGAASAGTLAAAISSGSTTFASNTALTGWTDITGGTFSGRCVVAFGYGTATEEKMLCTYSTSTGNFTIINRGYDGTSSPAGGWPINTIFNLVWSANEAAEANAAVQNTIAQITSSGDLLYGTGSHTMTRLPIGSTGQALVSNGSTPYWSSIVGAQGAQGTQGNQGTQGASGGIPFTANGQLQYGTGSGTANLLGIGSTGQVLTVAGGVPTWAASSGGSGSINLTGQTDNAFSSTITTTPQTIFTKSISGNNNYVINYSVTFGDLYSTGTYQSWSFALYIDGTYSETYSSSNSPSGASDSVALTHYYSPGNTGSHTITIQCSITSSSGTYNPTISFQSMSVIGAN